VPARSRSAVYRKFIVGARLPAKRSARASGASEIKHSLGPRESKRPVDLIPSTAPAAREFLQTAFFQQITEMPGGGWRVAGGGGLTHFRNGLILCSNHVLQQRIQFGLRAGIYPCRTDHSQQPPLSLRTIPQQRRKSISPLGEMRPVGLLPDPVGGFVHGSS